MTLLFLLIFLSWSNLSWGDAVGLDSIETGKQSLATPSQKSEIIEDIVVTGSKTERSLNTAPVKTELVKKETIVRNHLNDLSEVLENIPGLTMQGLTGRMGRSAVIQGLGEDKVLVLIDGVRQIQTSSSGYDLTQIAANDIERVEVIKGGASALYGSQAIGGVINVITKKANKNTQYFLDLKNSQSSGQVHQNLQGDAQILNMSLSGQSFFGIEYKVSAGHRQRGAIDRDKSSIAQDYGQTRRTNFSLHVSKDLNAQNKLYLDYRVLDEDLKQTLSQKIQGSSKFKPVNNNSQTQTQNLSLGLKSRIGQMTNMTNSLSLSQISDDLDLTNDPMTPYPENLQTASLSMLVAESQVDHVFSAKHMTSFGLMYRDQFMDQSKTSGSSSGTNESITEIDNKSMMSFATYVQHTYTPGVFEFSPGVRWQYDSDFGDYTSPSINFRYSPQIFSNLQTNIRSSIGTGYRVPSLKERFYVVDHRGFGNYRISGSDDLHPEKSISYQLGVEFRHGNQFSFYVNGFVNNIDDVIAVTQNMNGSGTLVFTYENLNEVLSRGVEIAATYRPWKNLELEQDLSLSKTENLSNNKQAPFRPQSLYKFRVRYRLHPEFDLIGLFRYLGREYVDTANTQSSPNYSVLDLKFNYAYKRGMNLYAGVNNVFNVTRQAMQDGILRTADNRPVIGRQYYLGLNYKNL